MRGAWVFENVVQACAMKMQASATKVQSCAMKVQALCNCFAIKCNVCFCVNALWGKGFIGFLVLLASLRGTKQSHGMSVS